jgi:hypothetical protein
MVTAMMKSIMIDATLMEETVVDLVLTQTFAQNVPAIIISLKMEFVILRLEMVFAMIKPIILTVVMMVETVV